VDEVKRAVTAAAIKYGVDPAFALAIAQRESAYGQNKGPSAAGAIGVMQLMPRTAAGLGVNPYNDSENIDGGVRLLSQLLRQYNGDPLQASAAYNWGSGNLASGKTMPAETSNYVTAIAAALGLNVNPSSPADVIDSQNSSESLTAPFQLEMSPGLVAALAVGAVAVAWLVFA
jgi:soluble lytic murein transglycosylase-like protein